jgi:hypothetical protein
MVDPAVAALAGVALAGSIAGISWFGFTLWTGHYTGWVRESLFSFGRFGTVDRRTQPFAYSIGLFTAFVLAALSIVWAVALIPALLEGKKLHSRFNDGTAIFDNEGITCPGDAPGYTHYHSCAGPPVPVPK